MFYRILKAPPGYPPHQNFVVVAYETLEFESSCGRTKNSDGTVFFATLEEAREGLPVDARQLSFLPEAQFVELWELQDSGA